MTTWPGRTWPPGRHYLDSGYLSAALVVSELATRHGIALIGPLLADTSAQARAGHGYARADFTVDYDTKTVTCPQGKTSASWTPCTQQRQGRDRGHLLRQRLRPLPGPPPVHHQRRNGGSSPCRPATWPKPRPPPAPRKRRSRSRPTTPAAPASKAPCTRPPATAPGAPATAACPKPASTTLYMAFALNLLRLEAYWTGTPARPAANQPPGTPRTRPRRMTQN